MPYDISANRNLIWACVSLNWFYATLYFMTISSVMKVMLDFWLNKKRQFWRELSKTISLMYSFELPLGNHRIGGVMVSVPDSRAVDCGIVPNQIL